MNFYLENGSTKTNWVLVGSKDFVNYVNAVKRNLESFSEVVIAARGRNISLAADVSQISESAMPGLKVLQQRTVIGTERLDGLMSEANPEGRCSFIEITMAKEVAL